MNRINASGDSETKVSENFAQWHVLSGGHNLVIHVGRPSGGCKEMGDAIFITYGYATLNGFCRGRMSGRDMGEGKLTIRDDREMLDNVAVG